jgi:hypothetical protein
MDVSPKKGHYCAWKNAVVRNRLPTAGTVLFGSEKMNMEILISSLGLARPPDIKIDRAKPTQLHLSLGVSNWLDVTFMAEKKYEITVCDVKLKMKSDDEVIHMDHILKQVSFTEIKSKVAVVRDPICD